MTRILSKVHIVHSSAFPLWVQYMLVLITGAVCIPLTVFSNPEQVPANEHSKVASSMNGQVQHPLSWTTSSDEIPDQPTSEIPKIDFNTHIAPIIFDKCASCHRPGQNGPFPLLSYDDVKSRAATIEAVINDGYMPPWKPVNHNVKFLNDRRLSRQQRLAVTKWIEGGMPQGTGIAPDPPPFKDGWKLGKPDLVVQMNGQFEVPESGPDIYRSFVFPIQLPKSKWIKAIEYQPTATSSVHHGIFFVDPHGNARKLDGKDGKAGIPGMGFLTTAGSFKNLARSSATPRLGGLFAQFQKINSGEQDAEISKAFTRGLGGYVPGTTPTKLPGDLALELPKGSDIIMQTHFHPSGKPEMESGSLALYFSDRKPSKTIVPIPVPPMFGVGLGIKIPPGEKSYRVLDSYEIPVDIELISIGAHAHYLCRKVSMTAKLPDGSETILLHIEDWDLDWQDRYYFSSPVSLPAGTVLTSELVYDNSSNNPENPNSPAREVRWGRESNDEMASVMVQAVAADESERPLLEKSLRKNFINSVTSVDIVDLLMQLDTNRDGGLQPSETPPRMAARFSLLDVDNNGKLERQELAIIRQFMPKKNFGRDK